MEQRSETWHEQRIGRLTCSKFPDLMKNGRGKNTIGQTAMNYIQQVAVEAITGVHAEIFSPHLTWGIDNEIDAYNAVNDWLKGQDLPEFNQAVFIPYEGNAEDLRHYVGGTPDGINEDAILEIKCPSNQVKHFERILEPQKLVDEYLYQVLGEMLVAGKNKALVASYDPRYPSESQLVTVWVDLADYQDEFELLHSRLREGVQILKDYFKLYKNAITDKD